MCPVIRFRTQLMVWTLDLQGLQLHLPEKEMPLIFEDELF